MSAKKPVIGSCLYSSDMEQSDMRSSQTVVQPLLQQIKPVN